MSVPPFSSWLTGKLYQTEVGQLLTEALSRRLGLDPNHQGNDESTEDFAIYATQLGSAFSDNPAMLELVLGSLFAIARADGARLWESQPFYGRPFAITRADGISHRPASEATIR